jgi:hypothetical protein
LACALQYCMHQYSSTIAVACVLDSTVSININLWLAYYNYQRSLVFFSSDVTHVIHSLYRKSACGVSMSMTKDHV